MKRVRPAVREAMTASPLRTSSSKSVGGSSRLRRSDRLMAIERMGASELFSSWPRTRKRRCHASRSSSRRARLRSDITSRRCGTPLSRNRERRTSQRPEPPGREISAVSAGSPSRRAPRPSSDASRPRSCSACRPRRRSPDRLTTCSFPPLSNAKMAESISAITARTSAAASSAPSRCSRKASVRRFSSVDTSPIASSPREPRRRME